MYANVITSLAVFIFILCQSNANSPQNNSIEVTYEERKYIVLEYLGVVMRVDKKHKEHLVRLHRSLLADEVNHIGIHRLKSFYLGKEMLKAYMVFMGETAWNVELEHHDVISENKSYGREDFKVFVIKVYTNISQITEISFSNYETDKVHAYFFVLMPAVDLVESRWYIVRHAQSGHSVMVRSYDKNQVWMYRMNGKDHEFLGEEGQMPWHWNANFSSPLQFYLEIFTNHTCVRTRTYIVDSLDVYTTKNKIVLPYVAEDEYCKLITFETCPIFNLSITYNYIGADCHFSYRITEASDDLYPCQLKMAIQGYYMTFDSPLSFAYENPTYEKLTTGNRGYRILVIVMSVLLSLALVVLVCVKKKKSET